MRVSECYDLSDNRLAFIAVFARTHVHAYIRAESMREGEPRERYFRRRGEKLPSIPLHVDDFSASYPSDTLDKLHVRTMSNYGQTTWNFLYGNQLSFDRCNWARACLWVYQCWALSTFDCTLRMKTQCKYDDLLTKNKIDIQAAKVRVWFLVDSLNAWYLSIAVMTKWISISPAQKITFNRISRGEEKRNLFKISHAR